MPDLRPQTQRQGVRHIAASVVIAAIGIAVYSKTLGCPFVFDDVPNIQENAFIRLTRLDATPLHDAAFKSHLSNRPVSNLSFALNYYFGRYEVAGYHAVNIMVHVINGILVYFLALATLRQLRGMEDRQARRVNDHWIVFPSLVAALYFVSHPLQTQSVTYIVQRMNAMAAMFYLLALLLYISGRRSRQRARRWSLWAAGLSSWVLALGSKQIAITLPFIVLLYEWCFFQNLARNWLKRSAMVVLPLLVLLLILAFIYLGDDPWSRISDYRLHRFTMGERVLTQFRVAIFYLGLLLAPLPARLNLAHDFATSHSLFAPITTLFGMLLLVALLIVSVCGVGRYRLICFSVLWFFVTQIIESSILPLEMVFEHRLYLPMVGAALLAACLLGSLSAGRRAWFAAIACALIAVLATASFLRNRHWQDHLSLWSNVIAKSPRDYRAHNDLGVALNSLNRPDEAVKHYHEALRIKPDYALAHNSLAEVLRSEGRLDDAIARYRLAIQIEPNDARVHHNLGLALAAKGDLTEAIVHYDRALQIQPHAAIAHTNLGVALLRQGRFDKAVAHHRLAIRFKPDFAAAHVNLGIALGSQGRLHDAVNEFRLALRIDPDVADAHTNMGFALASMGRLDEAINHYRLAVTIRPGDAPAHNGLAAVLARQGRLDEALRHVREALRLDPEFARARANLEAILKKKNNPDP